ncbi:MAG: TetR/AcrR family transcriptional regulator [Acidobacteria bacterium]|nr:TetR/AcrR family transcriptional regulator [Acidobacteriota bacterium]MBI3657039.1 TetR/AcrR family transcriptional regulator [Acidobacteriota bacterium]
MGSKERRGREKKELRQVILDAARELFLKQGYENVSMRKIANQIEYSPTTIYLHFKDKVDLLHCLCHETLSQLVKAFAALSQDMKDPVNCLRKGLRVYIEFGLKYPDHYKVTFILHPDHVDQPGQEIYEQTAAISEEAFGFLRLIVAECVRRKKFRKVDVETTSQAIWSAAHGVTSLLIAHHEFPWVEKNKLIDHLIEMLIKGLKA